MTISPVMSSMIMSFVPSAKGKEIDAEHQRIINLLKSLGITPTMNKEVDKLLLREAITKMESKAESKSDYVPFKDIMDALNITTTGKIDKDYNNTIKELDYRISMAADDEERAYYQDLKDQVNTLYSENSYDKSRQSMFTGASQIADMNKFFML